MKDYERYMSRQRLSETGMARLVRLETERPPRGERTEKQGTGRSGWLKYAAVAACLVLAVGLLAKPVMRGIGQLARGGEEELFFYEEDTTDSFVSGSQYGEAKEVLEPGEAAEIFGCAPDDFVGFLETMGLEKFDLRYRVMDTGSDYFRFLMEGSYTSPKGAKPANWDEISDVDWDVAMSVSSRLPSNDVTLDIQEIKPETAGDWSWCRYEPRTYHGCQVVAVRETRGYSAGAVFIIESGGKTYKVIYGADLYGEANAQELVTKMVAYLTQNGLFIQDRAEAQVKTTGFYRMEGDANGLFLPTVSFREDGSFQCTSDLASSHWCRGSYEVADGRVTAVCDQHRFVFEIDGDTLRYIGAESDEMVRYMEPKVTDGAVFRWEEIVYGVPLDDANEDRPEVEIVQLESSLWENDSGTDKAKGGVKYELTYQANEAAVGKRLDFYMELSEEDQALLGLDGPTRIQTYCREAGECGSVKEVYGDFTMDGVSGQDIGDVTVWCVCDGDEIARATLPWGRIPYTVVIDVPTATHHPEPEHHVEPTHHAEPTHHPEPEHDVEVTHHPEPTHHVEPSHHAVGITETDWTDGRWIADDQFVSDHHSSHH